MRHSMKPDLRDDYKIRLYTRPKPRSSRCPGSGTYPSQVRFEFGEHHLNRVQVRAVGARRETSSLHRAWLWPRQRFVRGEVVQDDDGSRCQFRDQHLCDVSRKGLAIHRAFDDPRRDQGISGHLTSNRR